MRLIRPGEFTYEITTRIDESVAGTTYVGLAPLGSAESAAAWQIKKIVESGGVTSIKWADGDCL